MIYPHMGFKCKSETCMDCQEAQSRINDGELAYMKIVERQDFIWKLSGLQEIIMKRITWKKIELMRIIMAKR